VVDRIAWFLVLVIGFAFMGAAISALRKAAPGTVIGMVFLGLGLSLMFAGTVRLAGLMRTRN